MFTRAVRTLEGEEDVRAKEGLTMKLGNWLHTGEMNKYIKNNGSQISHCGRGEFTNIHNPFRLELKYQWQFMVFNI